MGKAVQETVLQFQECLIEAALTKNVNRPQHLVEADIALTKLRFYLRLCRDLRLISPKQFEYSARMLSEIGKLLGGWQKSV